MVARVSLLKLVLRACSVQATELLTIWYNMPVHELEYFVILFNAFFNIWIQVRHTKYELNEDSIRE